MSLSLIKTSLGDFTFDFVFRADYELRNKITEHPVHSQANVTDHAYEEPARITLEFGASDTMLGDGGSVDAFSTLCDIKKSLEPLQLVTRLDVYNNMLIESITVPDDFKTSGALKATVTLREIRRADTQYLKTNVTNNTNSKSSKSPNKTSSTNSGEVQAEEASDSGYSIAAQTFGGGTWAATGE